MADDLLKNDGKKFIEMMEQLAERRMAREEDAKDHYAATYGGHSVNGGNIPNPHNHPSPEEEEYEEEEEEEEEFDESQDEDYEEEEVIVDWTHCYSYLADLLPGCHDGRTTYGGGTAHVSDLRRPYVRAEGPYSIPRESCPGTTR